MAMPEEKSALAALFKIDPEGAKIMQAILRALQADLAEISAAPRRFASDEALVDDLPDYVGVPYEPTSKSRSSRRDLPDADKEP